MEKIKAIQTRYKGYHFRSRLEARWAVFFDAMGFRWEYEPEGFELGCGERYLPDFLIEGRYYAEIKPAGTPLPIGGKLERFCVLANTTVLLLCGAPEIVIYPALTSADKEYTNQTGKKFYYVPIAFEPALSKYSPVFWLPEPDYREWALAGAGADDDSIFFMGIHPDHYATCERDTVVAAIHAARSARFEFGQEGAA